MGARISTGLDSKQDYRTPADFMAAVTRRFGPIAFDLAAHADNAQSPNYFAPCTGPEGPMPLDKQAFGMDAFDHSWSLVSDSLFKGERSEGGRGGAGRPDEAVRSTGRGGGGGRAEVPAGEVPEGGKRKDGSRSLLWLNCEFKDIERWARRCCREAALGASILLLTPAAVGANWFRDLIAGHGDIYLLNGRLSFIPGQTYNKDCMLTHFYQTIEDRDATLVDSLGIEGPQICVWDWRNDLIMHLWELADGWRLRAD